MVKGCWSFLGGDFLGPCFLLLRLDFLGAKYSFLCGAWLPCLEALGCAVVEFFDLFPEDGGGGVLVEVLAAFALAGYDEAGGGVAQAYGGFDLVDVLAALASGAEGFDFTLGEEFLVGVGKGDERLGHCGVLAWFRWGIVGPHRVREDGGAVGTPEREISVERVPEDVAFRLDEPALSGDNHKPAVKPAK